MFKKFLKGVCIAIVMIIIITIFFMGMISKLLFPDDRMDKDELFTYVKENYELIEVAVEEINQLYDVQIYGTDIKDILGIPFPDGVKKINMNESTVDFHCGGYGVGSGTGYTGFYYVLSENKPYIENNVANFSVLGYNGRFVPQESGWWWHEINGDNSVYIENIIGDFYYYREDY